MPRPKVPYIGIAAGVGFANVIPDMKQRLLSVFLLTTTLFAGLATTQAQTALATRPQAEKYLNDQAKGNLIKIIGPKNDEGKLAPEVWQYVYYDPFAGKKGRFVQILQGKILLELTDRLVETDRGRLLDYKEEEILPVSELTVDSDAALTAAVQAGGLSDYKLTGADYELLQDKKLGPIWILNLYGPYKGEEVKAATAKVSAADGKVVSFKLLEENLRDQKPAPGTKH